MTTKTATPPCFGKLFDSADTDCGKCAANEQCKNAMNPTPAMEVAPASAPETDTLAALRDQARAAGFDKEADQLFLAKDEAGLQKLIESASKPATPAVEPEVVDAAPATLEDQAVAELENEAATKAAEAEVKAAPEATGDIATLAANVEKDGPSAKSTVDETKAQKTKAKKAAAKKAAPKKADAKAADPAAADSKPAGTTRQCTALKVAMFKKQDDGKFILIDKAKEADLVINAGDTVKIVNPRSKYNGQNFVISCYSEKYECFRGTQPATKQNADFLPHQIEIIERAAAATA
ncbi:uncharacterized protein Dvar_40830 [Desulfosarcina variabilis str. Montpellier]|uniref:hypothetical protein n=1 Tax=Desulfosarcina variabilis TaxID=2300 RepID=UPI003AFA9C01